MTANTIRNDVKWSFTDAELAEHPTVYRPDLMAGKRVVVTGGGTGMGRAMTFLFARLGASVTICGRREEKLQATAQAVQELCGATVETRAMSIREPEAVDSFLDEVFAAGGLDILVNNAGGQFPQDAIDFSRNGWRSVIDLNLNGTWWMMQGAAQRWRAKGGNGSIVNIVAHVGRGMPQAAHTCAARAGVIYLSKTVATEWAPLGIRVNCVAPGAIATEGLSAYPPEATARFNDVNPQRRMGDVWDVAEGVVYLSADSGGFVTGEVLTIDGGMQMWGTVWPAGVPEHFNVP
ncbi:SDR family oxidoreductase [Roseibacterium sp. SDUM158016]|uniref:SDR family oxidoreductase n=1 Tax=Roseicyclus sediminis TaxID=2980997 RepID=UPI0021D3C831|nr:SDR family oxidoreductase [Roseibacterium sp. SDUM158016]MCU4652102.1 SDR family oxidoreductase [Roseibacterium sp. SDUM158016]